MREQFGNLWDLAICTNDFIEAERDAARGGQE